MSVHDAERRALYQALIVAAEWPRNCWPQEVAALVQAAHAARPFDWPLCVHCERPRNQHFGREEFCHASDLARTTGGGPRWRPPAPSSSQDDSTTEGPTDGR